jgi:uncharacterized membrane protein (UPF0127 family)
MRYLLSLLLIVSFIGCGKGGSSSSTESAQEAPTTQTSPQETNRNPLKYVELVSPSEGVIKTSIAYTNAEKTKGLQGVRDSEFNEDQGKLFFYHTTTARSFWMPNTYFDLDLIYLDENLKVLDIVPDLPHYEGNVSSEIPRAPSIASRHVLEMKASSSISSTIKIGDVLEWKSPLTLRQTEIQLRNQ